MSVKNEYFTSQGELKPLLQFGVDVARAYRNNARMVAAKQGTILNVITRQK
jgi:hypothetical protein